MHLTLHLTRACNLDCSYCYAPPQAGPGMTFETGCKVLRFGARTTDGSCGIIFFGGEPLLHKELIRDLVAEARAMHASRRANSISSSRPTACCSMRLSLNSPSRRTS